MRNLSELIGKFGKEVDELVQPVLDHYGPRGVPIVRPQRQRDRKIWEEYRKLALVIHDRSRADIWARADASPSTIFHEAQHLHRYHIDGVKELHQHEQKPKVLIGLENDLEHLIIVPQLLTVFPDSRAYWEADIDKSVNDTANEQHPGAKRLNMTKAYLLSRTFFADSGAARTTEAFLRHEGLYDQIEMARSDYLDGRSSKLDLAKAVLTAGQWPLHGLGLQAVD